MATSGARQTPRGARPNRREGLARPVLPSGRPLESGSDPGPRGMIARARRLRPDKIRLIDQPAKISSPAAGSFVPGSCLSETRQGTAPSARKPADAGRDRQPAWDGPGPTTVASGGSGPSLRRAGLRPPSGSTKRRQGRRRYRKRARPKGGLYISQRRADPLHHPASAQQAAVPRCDEFPFQTVRGSPAHRTFPGSGRKRRGRDPLACRKPNIPARLSHGALQESSEGGAECA
jgi:hypothetical protein